MTGPRLIMYDSSGRMCVNIVRKADRQPFAPYTKGLAQRHNRRKSRRFWDPTGHISALHHSIPRPALCAHHLEDNLVPGRRGTDNIRWLEFQGGDRLLLTPIEDGKEACSPAKTPPTNFSEHIK